MGTEPGRRIADWVIKNQKSCAVEVALGRSADRLGCPYGSIDRCHASTRPYGGIGGATVRVFKPAEGV